MDGIEVNNVDNMDRVCFSDRVCTGIAYSGSLMFPRGKVPAVPFFRRFKGGEI